MAVGTRANKTPQGVTAASFRVAKKTSKATKKASKAKKSKPRPSKTAAPPLAPCEEVIVDETSTGTVTPDEIEETPSAG
ncbi:MAG: hypothetical protein ALECFALPRED_006679 [Alectoria fallacina]|uniref:Uncharacterized protein n=1 Tax=Alectoria fallacina TaxID=1903189 RepID=A0A8H3I7R9_9LECA|nr:MAG: hypothetical protein ALECFALPRED_006679 [Alectoria fallacina]